MRKGISIFTLFTLCLTLALLAPTLCGCRTDPAPPEVLSDAFCATLEGSCNGSPFRATLTAAAADGGKGREATLTFYAPEALCGTTLTRTGEGEVSLSFTGEAPVPALTLGANAAKPFLPLLELLEVSPLMQGTWEKGGESSTACDGITMPERVFLLRDGERRILLSEDGIPLCAENSTACVKVTDFTPS